MTIESKKDREPWQIAAARFCVEHQDKEFNHSKIKEFLKIEGYEIAQFHIDRFFYEEIQHPAGSQYNRAPRLDDKGTQNWTAPLQLVSTIVDYDELKHARQNAKSAWRMAILALVVSGIAAIFQALQYFQQLSTN